MKWTNNIKQFLRRNREMENNLARTTENTSYERVKLMERILGHIGLPEGVIHNLDSLKTYCKSEEIPLVEYRNGSDTNIITKLGKAVYTLTYDGNGNFDGLSAQFSVKTGGHPLFM